MTPARKTSGILLLAGLTAGAAMLLSPVQRGSARATPTPPPELPGGIKLRAALQSSHFLVGASDTHMAITLEAPKSTETRVRPAVNLAIVIDRSGSMSGAKLEDAKLAARQLVVQLRADDLVAIVVYGSDVEVPFRSMLATTANKQTAIAAIDAIYDDGGTNLSGGLEAGRTEVLSHPGVDAVARVVLISDGLANQGIVNRDRLAQLAHSTAERGVSITTVGIGLDFDERTMTRLAVSGRGNYYFVESSDQLPEMFAAELNKLGATSATQIKIALTPAPGVQVLEAYGYPIVREGNQLFIPVADLQAGELRKVVLRIRVNATEPGAMDIARVAVGYRPIDGPVGLTQSVVARTEVTRNNAAVIGGLDKNAIRHIERARTAQTINEATVLWEKGDRSGAARMVRKRKAASMQMALEVNDEAFGDEMDAVAQKAQSNFSSTPAPASSAGKRARKTNRKDAHDLMH